jgi:antitoxin CptB
MNPSSKDPYLDHRKRLTFRAWHRGTREMDFILGSFADQNVNDMSAEELEFFDDLLQIGDPILYNWYLGKEDIPANMINPVLEKYLAHKVA